MFGLHLEQGAAVFDGHDLDEIRQIAVPVSENGPRDVRPRVGQVVLDELMEAEGIEPNFVDGLRVTDHQTMRVVQRMLVGEVNADIVSMLSSHGAEAIGVAGDVLHLRRGQLDRHHALA